MIAFVSPSCVISASIAPGGHAVTSPHLFVFGLGYVGLPFALKMKEMGFTVRGTTRSQTSSATATAYSIPSVPTQSLHSPHLRNFVHQNLTTATHILSTVPPDTEGDSTIRDFANSISSAASLTWLGYISSTSVYGDHDGRWVDETSPSLDPSTKGRRRLQVEAAWSHLGAKAGCKSFIFRLSGIYGPGRSALHTLHHNPAALSLTNDTKDMIVSRIHLNDIVDALAAATTIVESTSQSRAEIINISDDRPASRKDVFQHAAKILKLDCVSAPSIPSSGMLSSRHRERSSKKVSNAKMKRLLLPDMKYPSFREGLESLVCDLGPE